MNIYEKFFVVLNVFAFLLMAYDKYQARRQKRRIPEKVLFTLAVAGGSAGIWLAMKIARHKTRHRLFSIGVPLVLFVQVGILLYITLR